MTPPQLLLWRRPCYSRLVGLTCCVCHDVQYCTRYECGERERYEIMVKPITKTRLREKRDFRIFPFFAFMQ